MRAFLMAACLLACGAAAQSYPTKPVRIVVPASPGGASDLVGRMVATQLSETLGQPFIVENRVTSGGIVGTQQVAESPPDGHTLLYTIATHVQMPHLFREPPWDPFKDFTPVTTGARSATVLTAHASVPFNTVAELVDYARKNPGKLNFASFGAGSTAHLNGELFKRLAGIDIVHVPYKGSGDATKDHLTGTVQLFFDGPTTAIANAKTGKVKLIATAAETRKQALPDLATMREQGYDVGLWGYLWFWGPGGMQPATVDGVYQHLARAIQHPAVRDLFAAGGSEASGLPPAEMNKVARELDRRWGEIIRHVGVKLDN